MSLYPIFPKLSTVQVLISSATVTQSVKKSSTAGTQALSIFAMPTNMYTTYRLSRSWSGQNRTYYRNSWSKNREITMEKPSTAKRILERLGIQTSSSFVRSVFLILKSISYFFGIYNGLVFYLETFGVR